MPLCIWHSRCAALGTGKAGHLPGSINQDTICIDKAGSNSRHHGILKKKSAADNTGDGNGMPETDEGRKLGRDCIREVLVCKRSRQDFYPLSYQESPEVVSN